MAMLAEKRSKVKWTLNPRGNLWAEDETNYGQRMLRKMGWEKGKGLGKNEDGNKEHVKVTYKNDKKGVGAGGHDDDWIAHQDDFNSVLSSLNEQFSSSSTPPDPKEPAIESLEKKSKSSRSRVHYHKFIQGKDLTTYSSKDIAAILGKKEKENEVALKNKEESIPEGTKKEGAEESLIVTYNSGQNIQDYFKQKMAALGHNKIKTTRYRNTPSEDDIIVSSKDIITSDPESPTNLNSSEENQENTILKKGKKHKKKGLAIDAEISQTDSPDEDSQANLNKKSEWQFTNHGICENSFNPSMIPEICRDGMTETLIQDTLEPKETENFVNSSISSSTPEETKGNIIKQFPKSSKLDEPVSTKRRKKRKMGTISNQSVDRETCDSDTIVPDSMSAHSSDGISKEIRKREGSLVRDLISSDEVTEGTSSKKAKKLKKKEKRRRTESVYPNLNVHGLKTSLRYNALQQMKLYFDVFPNRQTLSLLKKYEEVCDNIYGSGLASSNLLSVHGYGNEFWLKESAL